MQYANMAVNSVATIAILFMLVTFYRRWVVERTVAMRLAAEHTICISLISLRSYAYLNNRDYPWPDRVRFLDGDEESAEFYIGYKRAFENLYAAYGYPFGYFHSGEAYSLSNGLFLMGVTSVDHSRAHAILSRDSAMIKALKIPHIYQGGHMDKEGNFIAQTSEMFHD